MLYPFGTDAPSLPINEVNTLIGLLRGNGFQTAEDVRCLEAVQCYASYQVLPPMTPKTKIETVAKHAILSRAQVADLLETLNPGSSRSFPAHAAFPWLPILQILWQLAGTLLNAQGS